MASIINDKTKNSYIIRLSERESPTGKRVKIFCGSMDKKQTQQVQMHVEHLIAAKQSGTAVPQNTASWVGDLKGPLRTRLESLQLIVPEKVPTTITVVEYMEQFIASLADKKPNTIRIYNRSLYFVRHFFSETKLTDVTKGQARQFKSSLLSPVRKDGGKQLCDNTARKMLCKLKTVFNAAVEEGLITKSPFKFKEMATSVSASSEEREQLIEQATIEKVIDSAPDDEFAFIIALARYGGLRTPSEFALLKHGDFKLIEGGPYFRVFAPKTAYRKSEPRMVPLFPELMPYVKKLVSTSKAKQGEFVFSERYRTCTEANITNIMRRTVKRAKVELWPKLWQNLRASRTTELVDNFPIKNVCKWLGNTQEVVLKHYLRASKDAMRQATQTKVKPVAGDLSGDLNTAEAAESTGTEAKSRQSRDHGKKPKNQQKQPILRKTAVKRKIARGLEVLPEGLEPSTYGLRVSCSTN